MKPEMRLVLPGVVNVRTVGPILAEIDEKPRGAPLRIDFGQVREFDSSVFALMAYVRKKRPEAELTDMSPELQRAEAAFSLRLGEDKTVRPVDSTAAAIGASGERRHRLSIGQSLLNFFVFLSDQTFQLIAYLRTRRGVYPGESLRQLYFMAYGSFPIITLMTFLVGITIALTSAVQLKLYGAGVYLADLIGFAMLRELVPLMTGIILSGKVGAAVAAEISTMVVLEEVDAVTTMGLSPVRFLMAPRLIAMTLAVPPLVIFADIAGILGGLIVGRVALGIPPTSFIQEMLTTVGVADVAIGLIKTMVFGWAIIVSAGYKGFFVGRSAEEVGRATTESVVLSISLIILVDCVFAFILYR
jgi:phospholipid/cholesterol/gamma-HCH transport system permease protein